MTTRPSRERFLILARRLEEAPRRLGEMLSSYGTVEIILDEPHPQGIWYPEELLDGYGGLMSDSGPFPRITAWSRALYHLAQTLRQEEAVWFIEEDVAFDPESFRLLCEKTLASATGLAGTDFHWHRMQPHWPHWHYAEGIFAEPFCLYQPLSRKSSRLIELALEFREHHGEFLFHEILFPSLAVQHGIPCLDWRADEDCRGWFEAFRYRPLVREAARGICHPVKDPDLHRAICSQNSASQSRSTAHGDVSGSDSTFSNSLRQ